MGRKRARRTSGARDPERLLITWRGYFLVGVVGAGLAVVLAAFYARRGDLLTAGLFLASLFVLLVVAFLALVRVRRLQALIQKSPRSSE